MSKVTSNDLSVSYERKKGYLFTEGSSGIRIDSWKKKKNRQLRRSENLESLSQDVGKRADNRQEKGIMS